MLVCIKFCEDVTVLQTEPKDLLVFALLGNGSDQIELGSNVYKYGIVDCAKNLIN